MHRHTTFFLPLAAQVHLRYGVPHSPQIRKDSHHRMKWKAQKKHRRNQNLKRIWISLLILASYGAWQSNLSISSACAIQSQLVVIQFFKIVLAVVFYLQPPNAFLTSEIGEVNGLFPFAFPAPGVEMALPLQSLSSFLRSCISSKQPPLKPIPNGPVKIYAQIYLQAPAE